MQCEELVNTPKCLWVGWDVYIHCKTAARPDEWARETNLSNGPVNDCVLTRDA